MAPYYTPLTFNVDDVFFASYDLDTGTRKTISGLNQRLKTLRIWFRW